MSTSSSNLPPLETVTQHILVLRGHCERVELKAPGTHRRPPCGGNFAGCRLGRALWRTDQVLQRAGQAQREIGKAAGLTGSNNRSAGDAARHLCAQYASATETSIRCDPRIDGATGAAAQAAYRICDTRRENR